MSKFLASHKEFVDRVESVLEDECGVTILKEIGMQDFSPLPITVLEIQTYSICPESYIVVIGDNTIIDYFESGKQVTLEELVQSLTSGSAV